MKWFLLVVLLSVACGGSPSLAPDARGDVAEVDAARDGMGAADSSPSAQRGPTRFVIDGDPNGLWWEPSESTLYLADNEHNRVLAWCDGASTRVVAALPPGPPSGPGLGQIVRTPDGTLVVTRFGDGSAGDVVYVTRDGTIGRVSNLDPTRRRIGLTVARDGTLYDGWFLRQASGRVGSVSTLTLAGTEAVFVMGLTKPVGVLAVGERLYVSDQERNEVLVVERASPASPRRLAMAVGVDLLCEGPGGSIFAGSLSGVVYRIDAGGAVSTFDTGYQSTRGVAYDAVNRRLFVADHDDDPADGTTHFLRVVPVDS